MTIYYYLLSTFLLIILNFFFKIIHVRKEKSINLKSYSNCIFIVLNIFVQSIQKGTLILFVVFFSVFLKPELTFPVAFNVTSTCSQCMCQFYLYLFTYISIIVISLSLYLCKLSYFLLYQYFRLFLITGLYVIVFHCIFLYTWLNYIFIIV